MSRVEVCERWAPPLGHDEKEQQVYDVVVDGVALGHIWQSPLGWWLAIPHVGGRPVGVRDWIACSRQDRAVRRLVRQGRRWVWWR